MKLQGGRFRQPRSRKGKGKADSRIPGITGDRLAYSSFQNSMADAITHQEISFGCFASRPATVWYDFSQSSRCAGASPKWKSLKAPASRSDVSKAEKVPEYPDTGRLSLDAIRSPAALYTSTGMEKGGERKRSGIVHSNTP